MTKGTVDVGRPAHSLSEPLPTRPTLEAVAKVAGVSRATVSRVIDGSPRVSAGEYVLNLQLIRPEP